MRDQCAGDGKSLLLARGELFGYAEERAPSLTPSRVSEIRIARAAIVELPLDAQRFLTSGGR